MYMMGAGGSGYRDGVLRVCFTVEVCRRSASLCLWVVPDFGCSRGSQMCKYEHVSIESSRVSRLVVSGTPMLSCLQHATMPYLSESSGGRTGSRLQVNVPEGGEGAQRYTSLV